MMLFAWQMSSQLFSSFIWLSLATRLPLLQYVATSSNEVYLAELKS